jgi:DNA repair protein RadC
MKTIIDLPEHSRPREKLRERGASALTNEELVAAILGMGTAGLDVRTIARQVAGLIREHKQARTCSLGLWFFVPTRALPFSSLLPSAQRRA